VRALARFLAGLLKRLFPLYLVFQMGYIGAKDTLRNPAACLFIIRPRPRQNVRGSHIPTSVQAVLIQHRVGMLVKTNKGYISTVTAYHV
jgi:hypothetical protein